MVRITTADDLCSDNRIYGFRCDRSADASVRIGGISFGVEPSPLRFDESGRIDSNQFREMDAEVAQYVESTVLAVMEKQVWVFLTTQWGLRNRITSYLKLWGHLQKQVRMDLSAFELGPDVELERDGYVCYAGMMRLASTGLPTAVRILRDRPEFALVSDRDDLASEGSVTDLFWSAYPESVHIDWQKLAEVACPQGDMVLRVPHRTDIPPHAYECAVDLFFLSQDLARLRAQLGW